MTLFGVFLFFKKLCESTIFPSHATYLWWAVGLGSFFLSPVSLQCIFWGHVFIDCYISAFLSTFYAELTGRSSIYCREGHEISSFFWMVVLYGRLTKNKMARWKTIIFVLVIVFYLICLVVPEDEDGKEPECDISGAAFAIGLGSVCGILNVLAYSAVCTPLVKSIVDRIIFCNKQLEKKI